MIDEDEDECRECDGPADEDCTGCGWPLCDDCVAEYGDDGERYCWRCAEQE